MIGSPDRVWASSIASPHPSAAVANMTVFIGISLHQRALPREYQMNIHYVGARRSGDDQVAHFFTKRIRIVVPKRVGGGAPRALDGSAVGHGAGCIRGPVGSVSACTQDQNIAEPGNVDRRRQSKLLIASTLPTAAQRHGRLTAGDHAGRPSNGLSIHANLARNSAVHTAGIARLT